MDKPVVSVCCITYNHSKFIRECLDGFLMQKVNFPVEFLIHDDASTDNTQEIIKECVGNDSGFKLVLRTKNIKSTGQVIFPLLFKESRGKYIAMCEGDDYWTDPLKLQKQVDFLEAQKEFTICGSLATRTFDDGITNNDIEGEAGEFNQKDLAERNFIPTASVLFKKEYISNYPDWALKSPVGDWPLFLICATYGKIKILNEPMVVRRVHAGGIWGANINNGNSLKNVLRLHQLFYILKNKFSEDVNYILNNNYLKQKIKLLKLNIQQENYGEAEKYLDGVLEASVNLEEDRLAVTKTLIVKLERLNQENKTLKSLNSSLITSTSYKLGRKITGLFKFMKSS